MDDLKRVGETYVRATECAPGVNSCFLFKGIYQLPNHPIERFQKVFYDGGCGTRLDDHAAWDRFYDSRLNPRPEEGPFVMKFPCPPENEEEYVCG